MTFNIFRELVAAVALTGWVYVVLTVISRAYYKAAVQDLKDEVMARYSTRKVVHVLGGGLPAALVPVVFNTPLIPFLLAMLVAAYAYDRRRRGLLSWFQEPDNMNEITFSVMWGSSMLISWALGGGLLYGTVAALFLSVGDGVTGLVRSLGSVRGKGVSGTIAMAVVCSFIGAVLVGMAGIASAVVSSIVERIRRVDDNILIPLTAILVLEVARLVAPWTLSPIRPFT